VWILEVIRWLVSAASYCMLVLLMIVVKGFVFRMFSVAVLMYSCWQRVCLGWFMIFYRFRMV